MPKDARDHWDEAGKFLKYLSPNPGPGNSAGGAFWHFTQTASGPSEQFEPAPAGYARSPGVKQRAADVSDLPRMTRCRQFNRATSSNHPSYRQSAIACAAISGQFGPTICGCGTPFTCKGRVPRPRD